MSYAGWEDLLPPEQGPPPPVPSESVGQPDDGGWRDVAGPGAEGIDWSQSVGRPDVGPKLDITENVGQQDTTRKRSSFLDSSFTPEGVWVPAPSTETAAPPPAPTPTESVGVPETPHATEDVGKKDDGGFWNWVKDLPDVATRAIPFTAALREGFSDIPDVLRGKMNPLEAIGDTAKTIPRAVLNDLDYATDVGSRIQGVGANKLNQWGGDVTSGDWGALAKDIATYPATGVRNLPYIVSGEQANLTPTEYGTQEVLAKNPLGAILPSEGGTGEGPKIPGTNIHFYDLPVVGGVGRVGASLAGVPGALDEGPSINVSALANDLDNGMSITDAMKKYGGNEGLAVASQFINPINFIELPGVSEMLDGVHAAAMGRSDSAIGRVMRNIFSEGSLAKTDLRAVDEVASRFAGTARPDIAAQALADRAVAPAYSTRDALRDILTANRPGEADQSVRILDAAIKKFDRDYLASGGPMNGSFQDYLTTALTPDNTKLLQDMIDRNVAPSMLNGSLPAEQARFVREQIAKAANEQLGLTQVQQASKNLGGRFLDYMRTGDFKPQDAVTRTLNDFRQGIASSAKAGLLAFSPRYYMQNIVDNVLHAVLDRGYAPFSGTITAGQEEAVSGIRGIRGTDHVPNFFRDGYGVKVDTGQTLASTARGEAAEAAARRAATNQRAGLGDFLRAPGKIAGKFLETFGDPAENLPRQSLWSRTFFSKVDPAYNELAQQIRDNVMRPGASPDIMAAGQKIIDGLSSGEATSFEKARDILAGHWVNNLSDLGELDSLRRWLPNRIDEINKAAATDAYYNVQRVFNNYDLHIKYFDTLMNAMFLFNKYQSRQPLYLAGAALTRPGFFSSQVRANEAMRQWNEQNRPGTRASTQERMWFGGFGINPLDVFPWDKMYNAIKGQGSQSDLDAFGLRQDPLSRFARAALETTGMVGLGTPALPAQLLGERLNVLPTALANVTDQPFIHGLKSMMPDYTVAGHTIDTGAVLGNALSPMGIIEKGVNALTGRKTDTGLTDYYTGVMLTQMMRADPNADRNAYKAEWAAQSGPHYDAAKQQALAYQQQSRDFNALVPTSTSVELPNERAVGRAKASAAPAVARAQDAFNAAATAYDATLTSGNPDHIAAAQARLSQTADLLSAAHANNDRLTVFSSGGGAGQAGPQMTVTIDANGNPVFTPLGGGPNTLGNWIETEKAFRDLYYANPYSPQSVALADRQRAATQKYGDSILFPQYIPKDATPDQIRQALAEQRGNVTRNAIDTGTFLNPGDRQLWLDYKNTEKRLGDVVVSHLDNGTAVKVSDLIDPLRRDQAQALAHGDQAAANAAQSKIDTLRKSNADVDAYFTGTDAASKSSDMRRLNVLRDLALGSPDTQAALAPLRHPQERVLRDDNRYTPKAVEGYTPRGSASALEDRFLFTGADPDVRQALLDRQNLRNDYWGAHGAAKADYDKYQSIGDLNEKQAYLAGHPELARTLTDMRAIDTRIAKDDRVSVALAQLREQEYMRAHPEMGFAADRLWDQGRLAGQQLVYEGLTNAQRSAYLAYEELQQKPESQKLFDFTRGAPKKGEPGYTEWWRANGNTADALRAPYNAALAEIQRVTGVNPLEVNNRVRQAQGLAPNANTTIGSASATSGGGGTFRSTGSVSGGGSTRRSSGGGGSSATGQAIAGRDAFYKTFDNLSSREKAALHDVDALDRILTKGARPSAEEWKGALETMNRELPAIRERQGLRDQYFSMLDSLSSREKGLIRDITSRVTDLGASADSLRSALSSARDRVRNQTSDRYTTGGSQRTSGQGAGRFADPEEIMKYGGFRQANLAINRGDLSALIPGWRGGGASGTEENSAAARTAYTIRTSQPRTTSTTTKKKVA